MTNSALSPWCTCVADDYNYDVKSDFLSYNRWAKRQYCGVLSPFLGVWQEPSLLQIWRQKLVIANLPSVREVEKYLVWQAAFTLHLLRRKKLHRSSPHKHYPSHLCLKREVLPGAKEQRIEGERQGASSNDSRRDETSVQEKWLLTRRESQGDFLVWILIGKKRRIIWQLNQENVSRSEWRKPVRFFKIAPIHFTASTARTSGNNTDVFMHWILTSYPLTLLVSVHVDANSGIQNQQVTVPQTILFFWHLVLMANRLL